MIPDVNTFVASLPLTIPAYVVSNADGSFTIILNAKHSHEQHLKSYHHEMNHIENGDYVKKHADLVEMYAHELK